MVSLVKSSGIHALYIFSLDEEAGHVFHQCYVPPNLIERGLKATQWIEVAAAILGGKKGGKDELAQGLGTEVSRINEALVAVSEYSSEYFNA
ncbi:Alanine--tRNA ligase [Entomophthora muscae]|uniref:Alanine--tRNA ligase n=1 Tax=Entomophthora muscae TaxID=34485 RepID=A0ACC2RFL6_9FUNG|nr:Alanine--tRNA ligase [Entomophthora muscae]